MVRGTLLAQRLSIGVTRAALVVGMGADVGELIREPPSDPPGRREEGGERHIGGDAHEPPEDRGARGGWALDGENVVG